ncbi:MAG: hypothetical protein ABI837_18265 [Acidobacteriota bacterium]
MGRPQVSFTKRQREQAKRERQQLKAERRAQRKTDGPSDSSGPEMEEDIVSETALDPTDLPV